MCCVNMFVGEVSGNILCVVVVKEGSTSVVSETYQTTLYAVSLEGSTTLEDKEMQTLNKPRVCVP